MKQALHKTESRKTVLFLAFTALVLLMLYLDAEAGREGATVAAAVELFDR